MRDRLDEDRRTQPNGPGLSPIWGGLWLASVQIWVGSGSGFLTLQGQLQPHQGPPSATTVLGPRISLQGWPGAGSREEWG